MGELGHRVEGDASPRLDLIRGIWVKTRRRRDAEERSKRGLGRDDLERNVGGGTVQPDADLLQLLLEQAPTGMMRGGVLRHPQDLGEKEKERERGRERERSRGWLKKRSSLYL